mgnify:CR=1 FL=1
MLFRSAYVATLESKPRPSIGLLNIGEEVIKGNEVVKQAGELLRNSGLNFIGNVEGNDIFKGTADVVVCDAVLGNVSIKLVEGVTGAITDMFRAEFRRWPFGPIAALLMRPAIGRIRARLDYERIGGAILLGVKGSVVITHGRARSRMVYYACSTAAEAVRQGVSSRIARALADAPSVAADGLPSGPPPS